MNKEQLKIKLAVGDRFYPLFVTPAQEESFRIAAKRINEMIKNFEQNYALQDKQDALAMCAIVLAQECAELRLVANNDVANAKEKLEGLCKLMDMMI